MAQPSLIYTSSLRTEWPARCAIWRKKLVGQDHFIDTVEPYIRTWICGFHPPDIPAGIFFLTGPTGVGKTYAVETLAEVLHGSPEKKIRIDCGEYQMEHEIAKLIGSPPGYLGHRESRAAFDGKMMASVRTPMCELALILFDEVEKASETLFQILLGIMGAGRLTLGDNSTIHFRDTLIFFTSNLGVKELYTRRPGFQDCVQSHEAALFEAMRKKLRPEFLNRLDEKISFNSLTRENMEMIFDLELERATLQFQQRFPEARVVISEAARNLLIADGITKEYGAREIRRVIRRQIINPITQRVMELAVWFEPRFEERNGRVEMCV